MEEVSPAGTPALSLERIEKQFGGIRALDRVDLDL